MVASTTDSGRTAEHRLRNGSTEDHSYSLPETGDGV